MCSDGKGCCKENQQKAEFEAERKSPFFDILGAFALRFDSALSE